LVPVLGLFLYFTVAEPGLQQIRGAEEVLGLSMEDEVALQSWSLKLEDRVAAAADDGKSWYLLGHSYLKLRRFSEAAEAFATTNQLSPMDLGVQVYWLQARYLAAGGKLDTTSRNLAEGILAQQPGIPVVIEMLALDAFHRGDAATAIGLLNQAMSGTTDIRQQANFANAIAQVRASMTEASAGVTVNVGASGEAPPHATVFVLARPVGGGMPYAVVRRPSFLLPFSVRLDDLVSMSPERKLSSAAEFEVVARLSLSGNAMPQADDWQWQSAPLKGPLVPGQSVDAMLTPP
jgi:cytochrome c-type biogenesis protein CcmH